MSQTTPTTPGRRSAQRGSRVNVTTLLAVVLPVLCALALLLVRPAEHPQPVTAPSETALTRATLVCPSGPSSLAVSTAAEDVSGPVRVGLRRDSTEVEVVTGEVTTADAGPDPVAVKGEDETAPGLVAARLDEGAAANCRPPQPTSWFTGVGAGARHRSVLELTNPDQGTAVADITVYGRNGPVDAPRLRGVSVRGGTSTRLDLATIIPRRDELALQVVSARGRIGATLVDRYEPIGRGDTASDWLPAQTEPGTSHLMLGFPEGDGARRTLVVANEGLDEVRATLRIVTEESVFTPKGVPDIRVPPQSTARLDVSADLTEVLEEGATGLLVTSNAPTTTTLRTYAEDDLALTVPSPVIDATATVLLPEGGPEATKRLLLAGATGAGTVDVVARSASGEELLSKTVELVPDRSASVKLPAATASVSATPARTTVVGSVLVTGPGASVVPLTMPLTNGLVPAVRPGLP